jgi:hypothetical protein
MIMIHSYKSISVLIIFVHDYVYVQFCPVKKFRSVTLMMRINQFSFQKGWSAELSGVYTTKDRHEGQAVSLPTLRFQQVFRNNY